MRTLWTSKKKGENGEEQKVSERINLTLEEAPTPPEMSLNVEAIGTHIYFYNEVNDDTILRLNRTLKETANKMVSLGVNNDIDGINLFLHINSDGGTIFDAFAGADAILSSRIPVYTIIEGSAASAATILSICGKKRFIQPHACMLIHQLQSGFWGKHAEFEDEMTNLNKLMEMIKGLYKEYTNIPMKRLNEILKHDIYFDAAECLEYGLVDAIL